MTKTKRKPADQRRAGGRAARRATRKSRDSSTAVRPGQKGGVYQPLSDREVERIHSTALDVLENIGMAAPIPLLRECALAKGCSLDDRGRLRFPRGLVEDVIANATRNFSIYGRDPKYDLDYSGTRVHFDPGGEAVRTLDFRSGCYRPSTLVDVYDFARLVDQLEHVHTFSRVVVATDVEDLFVNDLNTTYASVAGTCKNVNLSFADGQHVDSAIELLDIVAGGDGRFVKRPFCNGGGCPVVSPLSYGEDNSEVCVAATRMGAPVWVVIAPQAGATAPAALAGTLVQVTAETLAALLLINLVVPGHPVVFGPWPFVSDLRTGAFSGGGGEEAVLNAAAAQIANFYDLASSVGAGMTDSKLPDEQAGYEKGVTTALAALAGANSISETTGMLASLMGCSFEGMVIDNDMLGCIQRALRGIEVTDQTLSYGVIREVVDGPGHFLGHAQTLELMQTEFLYPEIADRSAQGEWEEQGAPSIRDHARERAREMLSSHYPTYIDAAADKKIRERFPIQLSSEVMRPNPDRW